ncbi:MAG: tetratricopeptide repeat protein [Elusimicrobia bacterium]|nr:tetratricopeptide repeat protein [Elusimicrobiota bacterium]
MKFRLYRTAGCIPCILRGRKSVGNRFVLGALLFVLSGSASLGAAPKKKDSRVDPIRTFQFKYQQNELDQAVRNYLGFLHKVAPGLEEVGSQYAVADMLMDRKNFEEATRLLKLLSEVPSKDIYFRQSVRLRMATSLMRQSRYNEAAGYYREVTEGPVKALVPEAMIGWALATLSAGDFEGAYERFREITALYPAYKTHPRYMLPLGLIQWQMRKYPSALAYFLRDDRNPASQYFAGLSFRQMGRYPEASGMFRRITQSYPDSVWADRARFELGETFYVQGDFLLAAHTFEDIYLSHRSETWDNLALYRLACCWVRMKEFAKAEAGLEKLNRKKLEPALAANVNYLLIESLAAQDSIKKIIRLLRKGSAKNRTMENNYRLVWARAAEGKYEKAVELANDFIKKGEDPELTPRTLLVQAYAFERMEKKAEAFATYQLVAEHFSSTPYAAKAAELSCMNFFRAGEYKSISTQVSSLWRRVDPEVQKKFPETVYWMGHSAMKLRDFAQAHKYFNEFVLLAPTDHPWRTESLRAQALAYAMDKSVKDALPVLQRAYQSAQQTENKGLMAKLTMDMGNIAFNSRKYEEAVSYYRRLELIDPKNTMIPFSLYQQALSLYRAEYYNEAADTWEKISVQFPRDSRAAESLFRASRTRFELGKYLEAVVGYETLVRNFPKSPLVRDARFQIGQSYFNAKEWAKAIESYLSFKGHFPTDPELNQVSNYIQLASYNSGMTVAEMETAFRGETKTPVLADVYWREGAKNFNEKNYDAARNNFQKILYEFPSSSWASQASYYRAESLFLQENYKDAVASYESFLQGFPGNANSAPAQFHLAVSYFSLNNFDRSAAVFEEFSKTFPNDDLSRSAVLNAAISYARLGDVEKTTRGYLRYAELFPEAEDVGVAFIQLGQFLEKVGQESRAVEAYRRVPSKRKEYPQALYLLARLHKTLSEPVGERRSYEALLTVGAKGDPYRIAGLLALADLHLAANDAEKALSVYGDVLKNATDDPSRILAQTQISAIRAAIESQTPAQGATKK